MKKFNLPLKAGAQFIENFSKAPFPCEINVIPSKGKITICPGKDTASDAEKYIGSDLYDIVPTYHNGGTTVFFEDQVIHAAFDTKIPGYIGPRLVEFLKSRGVNAWIDGNDVMCDWHKVCGESIVEMKDIGYWYRASFISIYVDPELINEASSKPMKKTPRGLSYYGITRQDVLDALGLSDD